MLLPYIELTKEELDKHSQWENEKLVWWEKAKLEEEYYYGNVDNTGTTYNQEQLKKIKEVTNIPVDINYLYALVEQKKAILITTKSSYKIVTNSRDDMVNAFASRLEKINNHILYKSNSIEHLEQMIQDALVLGHGAVEWNREDYKTPGSFGIALEYSHPTYYIFDPNARKKSLADMNGYYFQKRVTQEEAKYRFSEILEMINMYYSEKMENFQPLTIETLGNKRNWYSGVYEKNPIIEDVINKSIDVQIYTDKVFTMKHYLTDVETGILYCDFEENYFPEQWEILKKTIAMQGRASITGMYVRRTLILNGVKVQSEILPIQDFPVKVYIYNWAGGIYKSYGMVHFIKGMQQAYDKAIQLMIRNGLLTNNPAMISPKGAITPADKEVWTTHFNDPTVIKEYVPKIIEGQLLLPQQLPIQGLSNFFPMLIQMLEQGMEKNTGINPMVQGNPQGSKIEVFSTLQQYTSAAMQRIQIDADNLNRLLVGLGNIGISLILNELNNRDVYSYLDEVDTPQILEIREETINIFKIMEYKLIAINQEALPSEKLAAATELMKIAQTEQDPYTRQVMVKKSFELSNIRGYDEMKEEMNTLNQLQQQIQQMTEQIERNKELMKQYENRALDAEFKAKLAMRLAKIESELNAESIKLKKDMEIEQLEEKLKEEKSIDK